ncbi:MAG: preprotein translocase subunit SecE [Acidobacteriota bacterium]
MKKENIFKRIGNYLTEVKGELKKVTWPTKNDLIKTTIAVFISSLIFGVFLFLVDMAFSKVINQIIGIFE